MARLKYIGGILPSIPSSRFVNSVFLNMETDKIYLQQEENEIIGNFIEIDSDQIIVPAKKEIFVEEYQDFVFSFIIYTKNFIEIFSGNRKAIELDLLVLINSKKINVHSELLISSFLNLYGKTLELIEESNIDLEKKGVKQKIGENTAFNSSNFINDPEPNLVDIIYKKFMLYRTINDSIQIDDIACIKDGNVYFNNNYFRAQKIVNRKNSENQIYSKVISEILALCIKKRLVNLEEFSLNNEIYEFLIGSEHFILEQSVIEQYLSDRVKVDENEMTYSVLDIGLQWDKVIYKKNFKVSKFPSKRKEMELMNSFASIT